MEKLRLIDTDIYVYNMYQPKVLPGSDVYNKRVTAVLFSFVPSFVPSFVCFVLAFGVPPPLLLLNVVHVQVSEAEVSVDVLRLLPIVCIIEIKVLVVVLLVGAHIVRTKKQTENSSSATFCWSMHTLSEPERWGNTSAAVPTQ